MHHVCPLPVSSLRYRNEGVGGSGLLGLPIYEAAFMVGGGAPDKHAAVCLRREHLWSSQLAGCPVAVIPPPPRSPLYIHTANCTVTHLMLSRPCKPFSIFQLSSQSLVCLHPGRDCFLFFYTRESGPAYGNRWDTKSLRRERYSGARR